MDDNSYDKVEEAIAYLKSKGLENAFTGIILGTGLSGFVKEIKIEKEISYSDIPHFPISTVESHAGKLIYGTVENKKVIAMQGRFHFYEGYSLHQIVFPIRVLKMLGIKYLLISNAAGAINLDFKKGNLMLINNHINLLHSNPLVGKNDNRFGTRFPDMSSAYNKTLNEKLESIEEKENITLYNGIYAAVSGPNLETRAEYRYLKKIGADAVGMSTVPEVIAANHLQLSCAVVSVITDECDPDNLKAVDIKEIIEVAGKAEVKLSLLFKKLIDEHYTRF
ncbi:MAG: purine-nucleoside phosphorylase [Bacteroidota bacterium]